MPKPESIKKDILLFLKTGIDKTNKSDRFREQLALRMEKRDPKEALLYFQGQAPMFLSRTKKNRKYFEIILADIRDYLRFGPDVDRKARE